MIRFRSILFLLLCAPLAGFAQVSLELERSRISMDDTVDLTLRVQGGLDRNPPDIPLPDGLIVGGMSKQFMTAGNRREDVVVYQLQPTRPGEYTLGPYNLNLPDGQKQLPAMSLTVTPAKVLRAGQEVFVTLESSADQGLIRQPIELTLSFYSLHSIGDIEQIAFDKQGFDIGEWREINARPMDIGGETYRVRKFINRLTPVRAGTYELNPVFKVEVVKPGELTRHPFGMMTRQQEREVVRLQPREPPTLDITEPPLEGRPDSYTGHIGNFRLSATLSPREVAVGDPLTLRVQLSGTGSLREALPPSLEETEDFKVYESRLVREDLQRDGLSGRKTLEQVIIPKHADIAEVPAIEFAYYNPETRDYQVETAGPFPIEVTGGAAVGQGAATVSSLGTGAVRDTGPEMLGEDLVYLKPRPGTVRPLAALRPGWAFAGVSALPFALWGLTALALAGRDRRARDPEAAKRRQAPRRLRRDLAALESTGDVKDLYAGIWDCLSAYLIHRLGLPPGDLDPDMAVERLPEGVDESLRTELAEWMSACDRIRFAGGTADLSVEETRKKFETFMLALDRELSS